MTSTQRVLTALRCKQPDRVPILSYVNPYVKDWYSYLPSLAEVLEAIRRYCEVVRNWHYPRPLMFTAGERWIEQRDLGSDQTEQIIHTPDGPISEIVQGAWRDRKVVKRWIQTTDDVDRVLSIPYVPPKVDLAALLAAEAQSPARGVTQVTFHEPASLVDWIDERTLAKWCDEERGLVRRLMEAACERTADGLQRCLEANMGPIYVMDVGASSRTPHFAETGLDTLVLQHQRRLVELIHKHQGMLIVLERSRLRETDVERLSSIGMDGLTVSEPPANDEVELSTLKAELGDRVCLISTLSHEELQAASAPAIRQRVRRTLDAAAPGGGLILSPCAITRGRDFTEQAADNLIAYLQTAHEEGRYPVASAQ